MCDILYIVSNVSKCRYVASSRKCTPGNYDQYASRIQIGSESMFTRKSVTMVVFTSESLKNGKINNANTS